jgi:uncharacterized protein YbaR (Trm112 family)
MISKELLSILACPLGEDRPPLRLEGDFLICDVCQMAFPIKDDIPQLLPENAIPLSELSKKP